MAAAPADAIAETLSTVEAAETHGRVMVAFGAQLRERAATSAGDHPDVRLVAAYGEHWRADGAALVQLCEEVERALAPFTQRPARLAPPQRERLNAVAWALTARGDVLIKHGRVMEELVSTAGNRIQDGGAAADPWVGNALHVMTRQSGQMAAVGEQMVAAGKRLQQASTPGR